MIYKTVRVTIFNKFWKYIWKKLRFGLRSFFHGFSKNKDESSIGAVSLCNYLYCQIETEKSFHYNFSTKNRRGLGRKKVGERKRKIRGGIKGG